MFVCVALLDGFGVIYMYLSVALLETGLLQTYYLQVWTQYTGWFGVFRGIVKEEYLVIIMR